MVRSRNSQIATLVERHTRYVMLVKLAGKDTETVISALIENARELPEELYQSLTWDRGKEMADHIGVRLCVCTHKQQMDLCQRPPPRRFRLFMLTHRKTVRTVSF
jgi:IS30 family transposase